ncbi:hypothetical protein CWE12_01060 [Aliidiomarina sedimenti]|uniref:RiboL-PSP-HEPN domain-containing protein n=1 Tax=Aliidiomarina sedimenti TaxID=1933879 RepID=A0ABY0C1V2_9GAMM|nr:hypothetical protein [Aliidiomarina sedimenti]RUO31618.1 hypothetical protein CWE12_01060 [Aliidiomarina sedimenti]
MSHEWKLSDMEQEFYIYIARVGSGDALYPLKVLELTVEGCQGILDEFLSNFKNILEAVSVPFHVGLFTASMSQVRLTEKLLHKARDEGCRDSFSVATYLMNNKSYTAGIESVIPSFQKLESHGILSAQFETLYKIAAIRFYGCLEEFSKQVLKLIVANDISCLDTLSAKDIRIGKSKCETLKARILQSQQELSMTIDQAYDEEVLNKGYSLEQYSNIFNELIGANFAGASIDSIKKLESSRHLFVHRSSLIDKKYIDETGCNQSLGESLKLPANYMYEWQNSLISYVKELILKTSVKFS